MASFNASDAELRAWALGKISNPYLADQFALLVRQAWANVLKAPGNLLAVGCLLEAYDIRKERSWLVESDDEGLTKALVDVLMCYEPIEDQKPYPLDGLVVLVPKKARVKELLAAAKKIADKHGLQQVAFKFWGCYTEDFASRPLTLSQLEGIVQDSINTYFRNRYARGWGGDPW